MAFYLTYNTLVEEVKQYIQRTDPEIIASIDMFIMLGERRVSRDLNILGLLKFITGVLGPGDPLYASAGIMAKPTRWLKTNSFFVGYNQLNETGYNSQKPLYNRENSFAFAYWPNRTITAPPLYYADYEYNQWLIVPTPDDTYPYLLSYFEVPALLDAEVSTNFLTDYDPDILISATLIEAFMYLKNFTWASEWEKKYQNALQSMGALNESLKRDSQDVRGGN